MSATTPQPTSTSSSERNRASVIAEDGLFSGALGALTVAVFFLIVDTVKGEPLFTPSLLGSVLFLGDSADSVSDIRVPMVFAYTGVHFALFVLAGMAAAFMVSEFEANPPLGMVLLLLFICFEAGFVGAAVGLAPGVIGVLGAWLVVAANLLAAAVMAGYLLWWSHPKAFQKLDQVWEDSA